MGRMRSVDLAAVFLEELASRGFERPAETSSGELGSSLERIVDYARAAWPDVPLLDEVFVRHLASAVARRPAGTPVVDAAAALAALHASDLWLACACASGDSRAIERFDATLMPSIDAALGRLGMPDWAIDETKQVLRFRFFVSRSVEGVAIADYSGIGTLRSWVIAAAVNASFRVVERPKRQADPDSVVLRAVSAPGDDLELEYLKRRYRAEFEASMREAFAELSPKDRNVLRSYHLASAGIDGVAALYGVHRVTAWRWVTKITEEFLARTRDRLATRANGDRAEISSVLRLIQSQLDAMVRSVLVGSLPDLS